VIVVVGEVAAAVDFVAVVVAAVDSEAVDVATHEEEEGKILLFDCQLVLLLTSFGQMLWAFRLQEI